MKAQVNKKLLLLSVISVVICGSLAYSHCQIPCGIYDDDARFTEISEHITTIEKSMKSIEALSSEQKPNMNQIVRWVVNKEEHADEISHIVSFYFMAQRIKPVNAGNTKEYNQYVNKVTQLHQMILYAMKAKQTTDLENVKKLRSLLDEFHKLYYGEDGLKEVRSIMEDKKNTVMFKGAPLTLAGNPVNVGKPAPNCVVTGNDMSPIKLSDFQDKIRVICSVPSLDTPVCDTETRKFNEHAASLGDDVKILVISMDLPFAQKRWCGAAGVNNLLTLSDYKDSEFGNAYGVIVKELGLLARAIFVVDKQGVIRYKEIVNEMTNEPDYEAALKAVKELKK